MTESARRAVNASNRAELRELLALLQRQGFQPRGVDDRPIVNVWSPKYLGGRPGDDW